MIGWPFPSPASASWHSALPSQMLDDLKSLLVTVSSTKERSGPAIHCALGLVKPILLVRTRIGSGKTPFIASRTMRLVKPPPSLLASGSENPYVATRQSMNGIRISMPCAIEARSKFRRIVGSGSRWNKS